MNDMLFFEQHENVRVSLEKGTFNPESVGLLLVEGGSISRKISTI